MHTVEKILNNTTPCGKIRASLEGSLHSSTLNNCTECKRFANSKAELASQYVIDKPRMPSHHHMAEQQHLPKS